MKLVITAGLYAQRSPQRSCGRVPWGFARHTPSRSRIGWRSRGPDVNTVDDRLLAPGVYAGYSFGPWSVEAVAR